MSSARFEAMQPHRTDAFSSFGRSLALALAAVTIHLLTLPLPFVNQEGAFNKAAAFFRSGDVAAVQSYFEADANTVIVPALGSILSSAFDVNSDYGCRLLSILCFGVLAVSVWSMVSASRRVDMLLLALILLNPLIWTFAGRGTADLPPTAIAVAVAFA
jgi:hypothetical protein